MLNLLNRFMDHLIVVIDIILLIITLIISLFILWSCHMVIINGLICLLGIFYAVCDITSLGLWISIYSITSFVGFFASYQHYQQNAIKPHQGQIHQSMSSNSHLPSLLLLIYSSHINISSSSKSITFHISRK